MPEGRIKASVAQPLSYLRYGGFLRLLSHRPDDHDNLGARRHSVEKVEDISI
jgi:hypothetical protein